jgi:signal transduction histidine kinase/DNA-binding response OmpR family regulator/ligand-binding sensor domain-containing protein
MYQDEKRFVWFGTFNGLNKYDGRNISVFMPDMYNSNHLSSNVIRSIIGINDNELWINTKSALNRFSLRNNEVMQYFYEFKEDAYLAKDKKNHLHILGKTGTLSIFNENQNRFIDLPIDSAVICGLVKAFIVDAQDTIRILYEGRMQQYTLSDPESETPEIKRHNNYAHAYPIEFASYSKEKILFVDEKGDLYVINAHEKIFIRNISALVKKNGAFSSIIFDDNDILVAFKTNGLFRLQALDGYEIEHININCGVFALWKDEAQNIIWIGTDGQGVYLCTKDDYIFNSLNLNQLPIGKYRPVRAIYTDWQNNLWLGTKDNGIIQIRDYDKVREFSNENIRHFTTENGLSSSEVFAFAPSRKFKNIIWIGSDGPDLNYYSYNDKKIHTLSKNKNVRISYVHALLESNDSILWIGSGNTLTKLIIYENKHHEPDIHSTKRFTFEIKNKTSYNQIFSLYEEKDSIIWIGMRGNGLIRFNTQTECYQIVSFEDKGIAPVNDILCIHRDKAGIFWLGTNYGLVRLRMKPNGEYDYKNYNENDGLSSNIVRGILENFDEKLWLSTNNGIILFDPVKENFFRFNQKTGLKIIEYSDNAYFKDQVRETYFFGGIDGVTWIKHEGAEHKTYVPPIYFTKLRIYNQEYNIHDFVKMRKGKPCIELNHHQKFFAVSFIAMDFVNSENSCYAYKLDNFSDVWMDTRLNEAQFTNIPPGNYTLHIKYDDATGETENILQSIPIIILPPWYMNIYAKVIYFLLIIASGYFIYCYIRWKYKKRKMEINRELQEKYKEEMYESKLRFFTNITHEFSTPLTLIYGPCDRILSYEKSDAFTKKYAQIIKSNAERLHSLVQEIIDFRRMETGNKICRITRMDISLLAKGITNSFTDLSEQNSICFETNITPDIVWNSDKDCFVKILTNLISNAFKYTHEKGSIRVSVAIEEEQLILKVHNTGKGIAEKDIPLIFNRYSVLDNIKENLIKGLSSRNGLGLAICHSMTKLLGGEITVKSVVNEYAEFIVALPLPEVTGTQGETLIEVNMQKIQESVSYSFPIQTAQRLLQNTNNQEQILIIDDNREVLLLLSDILSKQYRITTAEDGETGLEILKRETPDLIITDIMMPNMDGITLTKQIKNNRHTMYIPLIILSAKNATNDKIEGLESGADAYIPKPFDADYLQIVVHRLLENRKNLEQYYNSSAGAFTFSDGQLLQKEDKKFLQLVIEIIDENINNNEFSPEELAKTMQTSVRNLYRKLKELNQLPPKDFIKERRILNSAKLLLTTGLTIQEIMYRTGFVNRSHFYKEFAKRYKQTPKDFRQNNKQKDESL